MKPIEDRCVAWKQAEKRLVRSGTGSSYARGTGRHCTRHQVGFMGARDAIHSIIDRSVSNRETARGNRWHCSVGANCIQCCVVPVGGNIGALAGIAMMFEPRLMTPIKATKSEPLMTLCITVIP